jgi:PPOX class probable F420-dependent enzyme
MSERLEKEKNIWLATVRASGQPHLVPVWFVYDQGQFYICIYSESVKGKNLRQNPQVALSLEDGSKALICEGEIEIVPEPWPQEIVDQFKHKYDWDIVEDKEYDQLTRIKPRKWLNW